MLDRNPKGQNLPQRIFERDLLYMVAENRQKHFHRVKVEVTFSELKVVLFNSSRILTLQYIGYETITPGNRFLHFIFTQTQNAGLAGQNFYGG